MKKLYIELFPKPDLERKWKNHKEHFDSDNPEYLTCMRCGKPMRPRLAENALSRALDVYVCPECGTDEALHAAMDFFHIYSLTIASANIQYCSHISSGNVLL